MRWILNILFLTLSMVPANAAVGTDQEILKLLYKGSNGARTLKAEKELEKLISKIRPITSPKSLIQFPGLESTAGQSKTFAEWIDGNWAYFGGGFEIKDKRFLIWSGSGSKSGEEESLLWVDSKDGKSAIALVWGDKVYVGSTNISASTISKSLTDEIKKKINSELKTAEFYDKDDIKSDVLSSFR